MSSRTRRPARPDPSPALAHDLDTTGGSPLSWLRFAVLLTLLTGVAYPAAATLLGGALFPRQAQGSLIERNGVVVGSALVGQPFSGAASFVGRPSAAGAGDDPTAPSGSNLAPSNPALRERVAADGAAVAKREGVAQGRVPADLLAASGSGIDPHISPEAAELQVPRVARARGLPEARVRDLVRASTERGPLGLGRPGVNVLRLNLALNDLTAGDG